MRSKIPRSALPSLAVRRMIVDDVVPRVLEVVGHQVAWRRAAGQAVVDEFGAGYLHAAVAQALGETLLAIDGAYAATMQRVAARVLLPEEAYAMQHVASDALSAGSGRFDAGVDAALDDTHDWQGSGAVPEGWR